MQNNCSSCFTKHKRKAAFYKMLHNKGIKNLSELKSVFVSRHKNQKFFTRLIGGVENRKTAGTARVHYLLQLQ